MKARDTLDRRTMKEIERFLKERRAELRESVRSQLAQRFANGTTRPADALAWATETLHDEIEVALMDRHGQQVAQIEAALERLGRREYGICRDCHEFIGLARLRALPFAQRCMACQSREEFRASRAPVVVTDNGANGDWEDD